MKPLLLVVSTMLAVGLLTGCQTYRPQALSGAALIQQMRAERAQMPDSADSADALSLDQAAAWMGAYNPELQSLQAAYERLAARSELKTPLPNPSLETGLARAVNLSPADAGRTQPFVGLGFGIPLNGKRRIQDDIRAAEAEAARTELVARHRELYLELRAAYYHCAMTQAQLDGNADLLADAELYRKARMNLAEAGAVSGFDVAIADLEIAKLRLAQNAREREHLDARIALAKQIGVELDALAKRPLAPMPALTLPSDQTLQAALGDNHPDLARLRDAFAIAEARLRLELAKQFPDLELGVGGEREPGEQSSIFSLGVGIDLPIFDRNAIGIAEAEAEREAIRMAFRTRVAELLAELDALAASRRWLASRATLLNQELLPAAEANLATARRLAESGNLDAVRYLELSRGVRELALEKLALDAQQLDLALAFEQATGTPIIQSAETQSQ